MYQLIARFLEDKKNAKSLLPLLSPGNAPKSSNEAQSASTWIGFANSTKHSVCCFQGGHYVQMEKQSYCRVCNSRTELTDADFSSAKVI